MKCDFCGYIFNENEGKKGCSGCPMSKNCSKIKCPNCNYEMYTMPEFKLIDTFKKWGKKYGDK